MMPFFCCTLLLAAAAADEPRVLEVGKGLRLSGMLGKARPRHVYQVNLHEGGTYVIDMRTPSPKTLDPFLRLLDTAGKTLASDDDSGGGLSARIIFLAPATGVYQVVATSPDGRGGGPYALVIKRDDARLADALEAKAEFLHARANYAGELAAARELLQARRRLNGASHWRTLDAHWLVRTLEKVVPLPAAATAELVEAAKLYARGGELYRGGKYEKAAALHRQALAACRKVLGEEYPYTALLYNNLGLDLNALGRYSEAGDLHRKSLDLCRKLLGEEHPATATSYNNLGQNLISRGEYAASGLMFQKALDLRRRLLGERHPDTADSYNYLAFSLDAQGKHIEAGVLFPKALELYRKLLGEKHRRTAMGYHNLGQNLSRQGKYAEAGLLFQKALELRREVLGEEHPHTAQSYSSLAGNLQDQGKGADAEVLCRKALDLYRKLLGEEHPYTATSYNNLAESLNRRWRYAEAEVLLHKALALRCKLLGEQHPDTADSYDSLAQNLNGQGKYAEARIFFRKALDVRHQRLGEEHPLTARSYNNVAFNLAARGRYAEAGELFQKTLGLDRKLVGEEHRATAICYSNIAFNLVAQGKYAEAEDYWTHASRVFAVARLRSSKTGFERAAFLAPFSLTFSLSACQARNGKPLPAWQNLEASLARGLLDDVNRLSRPMSDAESRREQELLAGLDQLDKRIVPLVSNSRPRHADGPSAKSVSPSELEQLLAQRRQTGAELGRLETAIAARQVYDLQRIQSCIPADAAWVAWLDIHGRAKAKDPNGEHWACVLRRQGPPAWVKLPGSGAKGAWTKDDDELPGRFRLAVSDPAASSRADLKVVKEKLSAQRLAPLAPYLAARHGLPAVSRLIVVPVGVMAGVPVEALSDDYVVGYVPSGTIWARLQEKGRLKIGPTLLAIGDPVFRRSDKAAAEPILRASRGADFAPLPGSRAEIEAIARLLPPQTELRLLGSKANEQALVNLADQDALRRYRYLHFATHGEVNSEVPLQSALILAQDHLPEASTALRGKYFIDGRLTAAELSNWKLDADLVVLSACQTGLGQKAGGEGYLGFSQALFLAGARSLVVSLWKVDDISTSLLMVRFYENLLGRRAGLKAPMPKAEALSEAKRWLRNLTTKEVEALAKNLPAVERIGTASGRPRPAATSGRPYEHPYYWAAFILIGDSN